MPATESIHTVASNYLACFALFPAGLTPRDLNCPEGEQESVFRGLHAWRDVLRTIYTLSLTGQPEAQAKSMDLDDAMRLVQRPVVLLWALADSGEIVQDEAGLALRVEKRDLQASLKVRALSSLSAAMSSLEQAGFTFALYSETDSPCRGGISRCAYLTCRSTREPGENDALLLAMKRYAVCYHLTRPGQGGCVSFKIYERGDARPLVRGFDPTAPYEMSEADALHALPAPIVALWVEISDYIRQRFPKYRPFINEPHLGRGLWVANYSPKRDGRSLCGFYGNPTQFYLRISFQRPAMLTLLDGFTDLPPWTQQMILKFPCRGKDCLDCGKHYTLTLQGQEIRLCGGGLIYTDPVRPEWVPEIKQMLELQAEMLK